MITFSAPPTEATLLPGLVNVVSVLADNTAKEISPRDVRDSVYTLWHNNILKPTTVSQSAVKYIGMDQYQLVDSPSGDFIYPKMYFGKKQVLGQFVMNDTLLGTDTDFFFYNMKNNQTVGNYDTTLAILAGTGSFIINGDVAAPTIKSTVVSSGNGSYINLNIRNNSYVIDTTGTQSGGDINIFSERGYVSLNGFSFPKLSQNTIANDGFVLKYKWINGQAYGIWESAFSQSITSISSTSQVTISGNPVVINGFNFTEPTIVATAIGGIRAGETFSNVSVMDMFRRIIYTYIPPRVEAGFRTTLDGPNVTIVEQGDPAFSSLNGNLKLYYRFVINSTYSTSFVGFDPSFVDIAGPPLPNGGVQNGFIYPPQGRPRGTYFNRVFPNISMDPGFGKSYKFISYTFSVGDTSGTISSVKTEIISVLPYFYGTSRFRYIDGALISNSLLDIADNKSLNKLGLLLVRPIVGNPTFSNNLTLPISTVGLPNDQGYIYFGYPSDFPLLKEIRDNVGPGSGFPVLDRFSTYSVKLQSPSPGRWGDKDYIFYILNDITTVPISSVGYRFIFAT